VSAPRALITGISGQDGSYLAEFLLKQGYEVFGVVRGSPPYDHENLREVRDDITLLQGDLLDPTTLPGAIVKAEPDELYHLAASTFVPDAWREPVVTAQFTAVGVTATLEAIRSTHPGLRYFQASTSEIFGATTRSPQDEATPFLPRNPYGVTKLHAHLMVMAYRARYGLHASSGILYNHESPRRPAEFVTRKVTRGAAAIKLGLQRELRLGNLDAQRDWSCARDVVEAMWLMLQQSAGDDYVIASGTARTVRELTRVAFGHVGLEADDHVVVDQQFVREADPIALVGDASRARQELSWEPRTSFEEMIGTMVDHDLAELRDQRPDRIALP